MQTDSPEQTAGLAVQDRRTGSDYQLEIRDGTLPAAGLRAIKTGPDDFGLLSFDPSFGNTVSCHSSITFVDGERGILEYRGYGIQDLAQRCSFPEVAYLLIEGHPPLASELAEFEGALARERRPPATVLAALSALPKTGHPMSLLAASIAALGAAYPDSREIDTPERRRVHALRLVAQVPALAAAAYRHHLGQPPLEADSDLGYVDRFLAMLFESGSEQHHDAVSRALEVLFILHADHEQNCSTSVLRDVASSDADPYSVAASAVAALSGPLHGGANEEVLRMLREIGTSQRLPSFLDEVRQGRRKLMGFGHRVYKTYDPRARLIKEVAEGVFQAVGRNPLIDLATELEHAALADQYFVSRRLYPNVDFYSGLIYEAMGLPGEMFTVLFAVARTAGWAAHWLESESDPERRISRPRQIYTGSHGLTYPGSE